MKRTEDTFKRLKKDKKPTFSLFGNSSASRDDEGKDEERIRVQMILDVEAFAKDAESLSIDVRQRETFQTLHKMVYATNGREEQAA
jgi:conserved oligomeric Golgi complex subunit 2